MKKKKLLHVGCGPKRKNQTTPAFNSSDWHEIRLDVDMTASPDVIGSMTDMGDVASGSIDAIFSSHNIEHLYPHEVGLALKEFLRVLNDDGFVVITCPDLQSVCALIAEDKLTDPAYDSPAGPIAPLDILYGHRPQLAIGNHYMAHKCGFTRKVLEGTLRHAGFITIATTTRPVSPYFDLWALATKTGRDDAEIRALLRGHFPA